MQCHNYDDEKKKKGPFGHWAFGIGSAIDTRIDGLPE